MSIPWSQNQGTSASSELALHAAVLKGTVYEEWVLEKYLVKFGINDDIDTSTLPEDIWLGGGVYSGQPYQGTPETISIVSSSADDSVAGIGARTVEIFGLESSTSETQTSEVISLNGTTSVASARTWYRVYTIRVRSSGSARNLQGTLTVNHTTTTANVFGVVGSGFNRSQVLAFTVPANRIAIISPVIIEMGDTGGSSGSSKVNMRVREPASGVFEVFANYELTPSQAGKDEEIFNLVLAGSDIKFEVQSVPANNTSMSGRCSIYIYKAPE